MHIPPSLRALAAGLTLALALSACSSTQQPTPTEQPSTTSSESKAPEAKSSESKAPEANAPEAKATEAASETKQPEGKPAQDATQGKETNEAIIERATSNAPKEPIMETFRAHIPTTMAFGAPMTTFGDQGILSKYAKTTNVGTWASSQVLGSMFTRGETDLSATPAYAAANMYNKGLDVRLVAGVVWGMIYVLGPKDAPEGDWSQLKGKKVGILYPDGMPDLVFSALLEANGVKKSDFTVVPIQDGPVLIKGLASGELDYGLAPEHLITMAQMKAKKAGRELSRPFNLQKEWGKAFKTEPRIPMAGMVMPGKLVDEHPELVDAVLAELTKSAHDVNSLDPAAITKLAKHYDLPEPVVKQIIPRLQVNIVPAQAMRKEYETFLEKLGTINPKIYGGKLPDDKFYAGK